MGAQPVITSCYDYSHSCFSVDNLPPYMSLSACQAALATANCASSCLNGGPPGGYNYCGAAYCSGNFPFYNIFCCCKSW